MDTTRTGDRRKERLPFPALAAALALLVLLVYGQAGSFGFVNYDDGKVLTSNRHVLGGLTAEGVRWAFTTTWMDNWTPLVWLSHMAAVSLFGTAPGAHHLVNVALHLANVLLLFSLLRAMTGATWRSALAAALFAVHPLHVESVAWVSERKDVLHALFLFLSIRAYAAYARRPSTASYVAAAAAFAASLASKGTAIAFPFLLLVLDGWPLGRSTFAPPASGAPWTPIPARRLLLEKVPFLALSLASAAVSWFAVAPTGPSGVLIPAAVRLRGAFVSLGLYLGKAACPASLAVYYPPPWLHGGTVSAGTTTAWALLLGAVTAFAVRDRARRPWLLAGWLWYLSALAPAAAFVFLTGKLFLADRVAYVPLVGIYVALSWGLFGAAEGTGRRGLRVAAASAGIGAVLALALAARVQASYWKDNASLFGHALAVTEGNHVAWNGVAMDLYEKGRYDEAEAAFRRSLAFSPPDEAAYGAYGLGLSLVKLGRYDEAEASFRGGLVSDPEMVDLWLALSDLESSRGRFGKAYEAAREAVGRAPDSAEAWYRSGYALGGLGRYAEAAEAFRRALRLDPSLPGAWYDLGRASLRTGDRRGVAEALEGMSRVDPRMAEEFLRMEPAAPR
jgi:tetratricopeptide (TPR) repeat protein